MKFLLPIVSLIVASCAPFQAGGMKNGQPWLVQSGGFMHKMKGGVLKAENGPLKFEQILEEPDGTEVPKQISADVVSYGALRFLTKSEISKDTNAKDVQINKQNNDLKAIESNNAKETTLGTFVAPE